LCAVDARGKATGARFGATGARPLRSGRESAAVRRGRGNAARRIGVPRGTHSPAWKRPHVATMHARLWGNGPMSPGMRRPPCRTFATACGGGYGEFHVQSPRSSGRRAVDERRQLRQLYQSLERGADVFGLGDLCGPCSRICRWTICICTRWIEKQRTLLAGHQCDQLGCVVAWQLGVVRYYFSI